MRQSGSLKMRLLRPLIVAAPLSAILSASFQWVFEDAKSTWLAPWIFCIGLAHWVFIDEVRKVGTRRTASAKWAGLIFFSVYLLVLISSYAKIFAEIGLHDGATSDSHDYGTGLYFSVITWTTVGYGDVLATKSSARFFAAVEALNGYVVLALFIAALVPAFQRLLQEPRNPDNNK